MSQDSDEALRLLAARHHISLEAVRVLAAALRISGGRQAQFNHPELGGMGQWQPGMVMIGDMFNTSLKARVDALASELSQIVASQPSVGFAPFIQTPASWWPSHLGHPSSAGGQNQIAYAYFVGAHRLLINDHGQITTYDTTGYQVTGVSQQQRNGVQVLVFHSPQGLIEISALPIVL